MSAYVRIYCIGGAGEEREVQGIYPLLMQILVGRSDHEWLEPRYFDQSIRPMGQIGVVIPELPDHLLCSMLVLRSSRITSAHVRCSGWSRSRCGRPTSLTSASVDHPFLNTGPTCGSRHLQHSGNCTSSWES